MEYKIDVVFREALSLKADMEKCKDDDWYKYEGGAALMSSLISFLKSDSYYYGI